MVKTKNDVAGIERTRKAITTTPAALMLQAMAKVEGDHKHTLRKQTRQECVALDLLDASHTPLYTIQDFGNGIEKIPGLDFLAITGAVKALTEKVRRTYTETAAAIPASHPAQKYLKAASEALTNLEEAGEAFNSTGEGQRDSQEKRFLRAFGGVILGFVSVSGQNMERASRELGEVGPMCGWLGQQDAE